MDENQKPTFDWLWLLFVVLLVIGWVAFNLVDWPITAATETAWQRWNGFCAAICALAAFKYLISYRGGV
jgi:hypothetical protein